MIIFGMSDSCRVDCAVIELRERRKLLVNNRFVPVTSDDGCLQIIRDYRHRDATIELKCILTGQDEVLLRLRPNGLTIGVLATGEDSYEHLDLYLLPGHGIHNAGLVSCEVYIHLIDSRMFNMANHTCLEHIATEERLEKRHSVPVGMLLCILLINGLL